MVTISAGRSSAAQNIVFLPSEEIYLLFISTESILNSDMAPDLNAVAAGGKIDYSKPGAAGYDVDQNLTWMDPKNRRLKVLTIGGGVTGILMAYQIQKHAGNVDHVIYEKNADIGGTWLENRYPGYSNTLHCGCAITHHS